MSGMPVDLLLIGIAIIAIVGCKGDLPDLLHFDDNDDDDK